MKNAYILFRSRNDLVNFQRIMSSYGMYSETISAPHSISSGCSLAIKTNTANVDMAKRIAYMQNNSGMNGIYLIDKNYGQKDNITKIF